MVGWHHQLNGHEFEWTLGDSEGQGSLVCCSPWGCKESDMTQQLRLPLFTTRSKRLFKLVSTWTHFASTNLIILQFPMSQLELVLSCLNLNSLCPYKVDHPTVSHVSKWLPVAWTKKKKNVILSFSLSNSMSNSLENPVSSIFRNISQI